MRFAVAGNFEEAVYAWRAAGHTGGKGGEVALCGCGVHGEDTPEWDNQPGVEPSVRFFQYVARLSWRVLLLWLLLFLFFTIVTWLL